LPFSDTSRANVSLTPELERFVTRKVESGLYSSQSEVVREGLRLLIDQERMVEAKLDRLRAEIAPGLAQARRGELLDPEEVVDMLQRRRAGHGE
jgi:antitoxin ParD1/3/4